MNGGIHLRNKFSILLLSLFFAISSSASAQTYRVINNNSSGNGSLSWAVQSVNYQGGNGHVIEFDSRIKSIDITSELTINAGVSIYAHGATLKGSSHNRIFTVTEGHVIFDSLTFTNGYAVSSNGGAVNIEGANASAEFRNCTFYNNMADNYGGAICITNGSANPRTVLTHCTVAGNLARSGGGLAVINGDAAIFASVITGNSVSYDIFRDISATLSGRYNLTGTSNYDFGLFSLNDIAVSDVLEVNENGNVYTENVNGVEVLKLSGSSYARDFVPLSEVQYVLSVDQTGTKRPQLDCYDAGAYEALPAAITRVEIRGMPYIQVSQTEKYTLSIYPSNATVSGIKWSATPSTVLTIDEDGNAYATGTGTGYITAEVYGWDTSGNPVTVRASNAMTVHVGTEAQSNFEADILTLPDITMSKGEYKVIKPEVHITVNDISLSNFEGWIDYELSASSSRPDIASVEVLSDDSIMIMAWDKAGSTDITVIADPLPLGIRDYETFTVSVSEAKKSLGHSSGGGGCNAGILSIMSVMIIAFRKGKK